MVENLFLVRNIALLVGLSQGLDKVQIQLNKNQGIAMFHDSTVRLSIYFWIKCFRSKRILIRDSIAMLLY